ncbi:MAG: hypothetical protein EU530_10955 [Promethearchaeota archaeon]|nr:MAG: hypothetical protein EU530_10955 [Candidatus Lokiarchaeota archaeon]
MSQKVKFSILGFGRFGEKLIVPAFKDDDNYRLQIDAFADCILNNTPVPIPGEEGLINQKIIVEVNK